ncbi:MAG TPA: FdrA, partial [Candidatus Cloacimonadota bacterium]|nr:FdrA [Candidatus Cloacimonadota bacterium]
MIVKTKIVQGKYLDSVKLMLISKELRTQAGVQDAVAILATRENMEILSVTDMLVDEISSAGETDLVIVIKADTDEQATKAMAKAEALLNDTTSKASSGSSVARSLKTAVQALEGANLCLISVAGKYAAQEADQALEEGL